MEEIIVTIFFNKYVNDVDEVDEGVIRNIEEMEFRSGDQKHSSAAWMPFAGAKHMTSKYN